jgi:hypothetical protein
MKLEYVFVKVAIMLLFFPIIGCFVPVAKAELPNSWVNIEITSFNGDSISFNLQVTVRGNHIADSMTIQIEPTSSGEGVTVVVRRGISQKIYSQDTNVTVFSFDYSYAVRSPFYEAGPKLLSLLLFPADYHSLIFYLVPSFNMTVDQHPTVCQVPSQNYQGTFAVTPASDMLTVTVSINHSESFFWGVSFILVTALVSLYGLTAYLGILIYKKKSSSSSNIVTVSSAIIFFVPAFEITFYSLKSPLPLVFSDILMIILIPLNAIVICFVLHKKEGRSLESDGTPSPPPRGNTSMTLSKEQKERKNDLEKLIDWEQNKQLTWAVVLLTATLGLAGILVIDSLSTSTRVFVIVLGLTLMSVLDFSFYRLATSLVNLRRYVERIGKISELYKEELVTKAIFKSLYGWFVDTADKDKPRLITWRVVLIIVLADLFILLYVCLILLKTLGYANFS